MLSLLKLHVRQQLGLCQGLTIYALNLASLPFSQASYFMATATSAASNCWNNVYVSYQHSRTRIVYVDYRI